MVILRFFRHTHLLEVCCMVMIHDWYCLTEQVKSTLDWNQVQMVTYETCQCPNDHTLTQAKVHNRKLRGWISCLLTLMQEIQCLRTIKLIQAWKVCVYCCTKPFMTTLYSVFCCFPPAPKSTCFCPLVSASCKSAFVCTYLSENFSLHHFFYPTISWISKHGWSILG